MRPIRGEGSCKPCSKYSKSWRVAVVLQPTHGRWTSLYSLRLGHIICCVLTEALFSEYSCHWKKVKKHLEMAAKPVIVFVPGAWHGPSCYEAVMKRLETAGYETKGVALASVDAAEPLKDFKPDVDAIQAIVKPVVDQGKDVLLVVHSYGGVCGTESVRGLDKASREKDGKKGGVSHLYYCCAFALPEGVSLMDALENKPLPWFKIAADERTLEPATPIETFYNDVEDPEKHVATLKPHSYRTFSSKLTYPAYKYVPSTYLFCEKDMALPIHVQRGMVENSGVDWKTETLDASHSPFLSFPDEMAASIRRAAGESV